MNPSSPTDTNNEELRKKLLSVNLIKEHEYTPKNVVLITLDDVIEIFHELAPYTMAKLDETQARDQQIALAAQRRLCEALKRAVGEQNNLTEEEQDQIIAMLYKETGDLIEAEASHAN